MAVVMAQRVNGEDIVVTSYKGCVLATRERNGYDDSDFYAVVWDEEAQICRSVEYATTRFYTYGNYAEIDATPEAIAKAQVWLRKWAVMRLESEAANKARKPSIGKTVKVIKGRKLAIGTTGRIFWAQEQRSQYGTWHYGWRYGIELVDGSRTFVDGKNVEVDHPEDYLPDYAYILAQADCYSKSGQWHTPFVADGYLVV